MANRRLENVFMAVRLKNPTKLLKSNWIEWINFYWVLIQQILAGVCSNVQLVYTEIRVHTDKGEILKGKWEENGLQRNVI